MAKAIPLEKRQEILEKVNVHLEAFTDDLLPAIGCKGFTILCQLSSSDPNKLIFTWHWDYLNKTTKKEFVYSITEPDHAFTDRVKAYFFDLAVMVSNL